MKRYIRAMEETFETWEGRLDPFKGNGMFDNEIPERKRVQWAKERAAAKSDDSGLLDDLSCDSIYIRRLVANNPHTAQITLADMSLDSDEEVRANVASNPNTGRYVLEELLNDKSRMVRARAQTALDKMQSRR